MSDDLYKRLRKRLGGVSTEAMKGDNLAIMLASAFTDPGEPEGENGWGEKALQGADAALDAIHQHYQPLADRIAALEAEVKRLKEALNEIAHSKFCDYDNTSPDSYGTGVTDGHRYCAKIARAALAEKEEV